MTIIIHKVILQDTVVSVPPVIRPHSINITPVTVSGLLNSTKAIGVLKSGTMNAMHLTEIAPMIMKPGDVTGVAPTVNPWSNTQTKWWMDLEAEDEGFIQRYRIAGFTSEPMLGEYNPHSLMFINSIQPIGSMETTQGITSSESLNTGHMISMRPSDILSMKGLTSEVGDITPYGFQPQATSIAEAMITSTPHMSACAHNNPYAFLADIVNSYRKAVAGQALGDDGLSLGGSASVMTLESTAASNPFLTALSDPTYGQMMTSSFTMTDLLNIDPSVTSRINYLPPEVSRTDSEYLDNTGPECRIASLVKDMVSSIISSSEISRVEFIMHNYPTDTDPFGSMPTIDRLRYWYSIKEAPADDPMSAMLHTAIASGIHPATLSVLNEMSTPGVAPHVRYSIHVAYRSLSESVVKVSLDNNPFIDFAYPTFADTGANPMLLNNQEDLTKATVQIDGLLSATGV